MNGIQYTRIDNYYLMELFQDIEKNQQYLVSAAKSIYDHVVYDSDIERQFAEGLEKWSSNAIRNCVILIVAVRCHRT